MPELYTGPMFGPPTLEYLLTPMHGTPGAPGKVANLVHAIEFYTFLCKFNTCSYVFMLAIPSYVIIMNHNSGS